MAVGETAKLIASLELKDKFSPTVNKALGGLGKLDSRIDRTSSKAHQAGQHIGIGIQNAAKLTAVGVGILASQVALGLNSLVKLEQAQAQTAAVIKSTGGAAGVTAEQVGKLAEKYESLNATVGDEVIRSAENLLLTFTKVKDKAFEPALQAILNMNTAMGKGPDGLQSTVLQVGKALNDPIKGITALRRAGVQFTDQQIAEIKALQKSGDLLGAQKIVLAELNKEFGGSFLAQGGTTGAKVAKFGDAIEDLQRTLAAGFLPVVSKVADKLSLLFQDPAVVRGVEKFGENLAGLFSDENLKTGADVLKSLFQTAKDVAPAIAAAATVTGAVVKTAVQMFTSLPKELQTLLVGGLAVNKLTGGLVTNLAGGLISSVLKQLVSGVVNVQGGVVNVTGGLPGSPGGGPGGGGVRGLLNQLKPLLVLLGPAIATALVTDVVTNEANKGGKNFANPFAGGIGGNIVSALQNLGEIIKGWNPTKTSSPADREHEGSGVRRDSAKNAIDKTTTAVENMRANIGDSLGNIKTSTIEAGLKAKIGMEENKAQVASSAMIEQAMLSANMATIRTSSAAISQRVGGVSPPIVTAIRANRPIITTNVNVNVTAANVSQSVTNQSRYGPGNGSSGQNTNTGHASGTGPLP